MSKTKLKYFCCIFGLLLSCNVAKSQIISVGGIFSLDNYGVVVDISSPDGHSLERFTLCEDHFGYFFDRTSDLGFKFTYTHEYVFRSYQLAPDIIGFMHGGAGVFIAYLHDREYFFGSMNGLQFKKEMGWALGLSTSFGFCIDFPRGISADCSFSLNPAFHYRESVYDGTSHLSVYLNGLVRCIFPRLSILYSF